MTAVQEIIRRVREESGLEVDSATPLYRRLQIGLRKALEQGAIGSEEALPPERQLADELGVSRVTVRNAIRKLVDEGLLVQQRGAGTFVAARVEQPLSKLTGFTEDMSTRGLSPGVEWLDRSLGTAMPEEALALNLSPGAKVSRLYRLRLANNKPMCVEQATLPQDVLPDPTAVESSLYAVLEKLGRRPVRALQRLRAQLLDVEHARLLQVEPGTACLHIERRSFLPEGRPVELVRSHYRGDSYDFVAELKL
jgi:GntR family transcriptional regulator